MKKYKYFFVKKEYGIPNLETNDISIERKIDELLTLLHAHNQQKFNRQLDYKILCDFIQKCENLHLDLAKEETEIAKIYNEILEFPVLLNQINITNHHRILSKALELNSQNFNYEKFIKFVIESITKYNNHEIQSLLVYFDDVNFLDCSNCLEELKQNPEFEIQFLTYRDDRYWSLFEQLTESDKRFQGFQAQLNQIVQILIQYQEDNRELKTQIETIRNENEELKKQNFDMLKEIGYQNSRILDELQKQSTNIMNQIQDQNENSFEQMKTEIKSIQEKLEPLSQFENLLSTISTSIHTNKFERRCQFSDDSSFDGILNYLKKKGAIQLNSGGEESQSDCKVSNLIDYSNTSQSLYEARAPSPNNWIEFEFLNRTIDLSSYQIKSIPYGPYNHHPKTWQICGSNDHDNWEPLDQRENCSDLNRSSITKHFICQTPTHKQYKYIRYYQTEN